MRIGIGNTVPERSNLPGQSGGGGVVIPLIISYSASAFCANASDPTPTVTGNVGAGTYSSTAGLVFVSTSTGEVDISASTPSATAYVITYTDTNSATATFNLTINALDNAAFSYTYSSYAQNFPDPTPTVTGLAGGTFSGSTGLVINSTTGEIDLDASTIAAHTITYDTTPVGNTCPNTSTQTVDIVAALAQVNNVYSMEFDTLADESVSVGNTLTNGFSQLSISLWANFASVPTNRVLGLASKDNTNERSFDLRYIQNTGVNLLVSTNGVNSAATPYYPKASISAGQWYHFVGVYDGSNVLLYVNGVPTGSPTALTGSLQNTTSEFFIGKRGFGTTNTGFDGKLDEVAVFNTALTELEVRKIYYASGVSSGVSKTADLNDLTTPPIKWYRMGD